MLLTFHVHHLVAGLAHVEVVIVKADHQLAAGLVEDMGPMVGLVVVGLDCLPYPRHMLPKQS